MDKGPSQERASSNDADELRLRKRKSMSKLTQLLGEREPALMTLPGDLVSFLYVLTLYFLSCAFWVVLGPESFSRIVFGSDEPLTKLLACGYLCQMLCCVCATRTPDRWLVGGSLLVAFIYLVGLAARVWSVQGLSLSVALFSPLTLGFFIVYYVISVVREYWS